MPRQQLILVPDPASLRGPQPIGPGYTKGNTPADMRQWAADLETHYQHIERGYGTLTPQQATTQRKLYDPTDGDRIRGSLGADGRVELDNGKHRAYYMGEQGTPVPVWVSHDDQRQLDAFAKRCDDQLIRDRPQLHARPTGARELTPEVELPPRQANDARDLLPDVEVPIRRSEPTRERGLSRDER